jgi:hypothetical protein
MLILLFVVRTTSKPARFQRLSDVLTRFQLPGRGKGSSPV